jgi:hypothetical protein
MAVETIDGILLVGWMERDEALKYLCQESVSNPPTTERKAEDLWHRYRDAVQSLPAREPIMPVRLALAGVELHAARTFRNRYRTQPIILDVIKVDPFELLVHQLAIATGISREYETKVAGKRWVEESLLTNRRSQVVQRVDAEGLHIELPHAEFLVAIHRDATFAVTEHAHYVSVAEFENRLLLTAGYHRSFAYIRAAGNAPDAIARSIVAVLTTDLPAQLSPKPPKTGLHAVLAGPRPPLFRDFFDERLVIRVKLRKKRYEIFVHRRDIDVES